MALVEIVVALDTSEQTLATATEFAETIGKKPIVTKDRSGFIGLDVLYAIGDSLASTITGPCERRQWHER